MVKPISSKSARRVIKSLHYSGKVVQNSSLNFGVFIDGECEGAMQFGPSMRKDLIAPLVSGTTWQGFIELNRLAFSAKLPRNSESRAMAVAFKLIRKNYPHIKWVISFSDAAQCGDGTIYRAAGFVLTGIKVNNQIRINPHTEKPMQSMAAFHACMSKEFSTWEKIKGYQLRYIYFIDKSCREKLTVPIIPFSKIEEMGAGMYLGKARVKQAIVSDQDNSGGAAPTDTLQRLKNV